MYTGGLDTSENGTVLCVHTYVPTALYVCAVCKTFQVWPESDQKLCQFHGCQAMWRWLCDAKHKISSEDRQELMGLYRTIMKSIDQDLAAKAFELVST